MKEANSRLTVLGDFGWKPLSANFCKKNNKEEEKSHKKLNSSKIIRTSYDNVHTFEKLMNLAFKQNQVWPNQMMKS